MVNGKPVAMGEYLGREWSEAIRSLAQINTTEQPTYCQTPLRPWQKTGVAKLKYLRTSRCKGGILGDEQGLGKTVEVLSAMVHEICSGDSVYNGFNLIITIKASIPEWLEAVSGEPTHAAGSTSVL
ncbi:hypothetical protein PV05_11549 [Exophiala xenobiotica]|uniref:SNF2 N-terminal domain-containing protein n=1 Tax=Exophiala xenobiotica TaxID=348802 RepID=A0A0D2BCR8_9EURO|nr:uncharacterized protein PV05_11549 [Exophiala xenobiotica]KIW49916.1 hypothetical protein PV05_11549 [Exophiala xenobiotica]